VLAETIASSGDAVRMASRLAPVGGGIIEFSADGLARRISDHRAVARSTPHYGCASAAAALTMDVMDGTDEIVRLGDVCFGSSAPDSPRGCQDTRWPRVRAGFGSGGEPVTVAVQASDAIAEAGITAYLLDRAEVTLLSASRLDAADVVLVLTEVVSDRTLSWMRSAADSTAERRMRFVLVGDGVGEPELRRAMTCGMVSVLPRSGINLDQVVEAIVRLHGGHVELPAHTLREVVTRLTAMSQSVPAAADALTAREVDVLRMLADGKGTPEIARYLHFSERTVKSIIQSMLGRMNLRNRPHAVAFALRNGLL
jgi:DNA-binding NarL/FixJ family response regulator